MDKLENYQDIKALGKGGYGAVNLVKYVPENKEYAMKIIPLGKLDQY